MLLLAAIAGMRCSLQKYFDVLLSRSEVWQIAAALWLGVARVFVGASVMELARQHHNNLIRKPPHPTTTPFLRPLASESTSIYIEIQLHPNSALLNSRTAPSRTPFAAYPSFRL